MKLLNCPCENAMYCGTMVGSIKLHRLMYNSRFRDFIHSYKGFKYLLTHYNSMSVIEAIHKAYEDLR